MVEVVVLLMVIRDLAGSGSGGSRGAAQGGGGVDIFGADVHGDVLVVM